MPDDVYEAMRKHAKSERRSIAAEIIALLEQRYPTERELQRRREWVEQLERARAAIPPLSGDGPTSTEMLREDRDSR